MRSMAETGTNSEMRKIGFLDLARELRDHILEYAIVDGTRQPLTATASHKPLA